MVRVGGEGEVDFLIELELVGSFHSGSRRSPLLAAGIAVGDSDGAIFHHKRVG
jgi:hypothetical protein